MIRQLVCEGSCNPHIQAIDADVDKFRAGPGRVTGGSKVLPVFGDISDRLRSLKHTSHYTNGNEMAKCQACGHIRRHAQLEGLEPMVRA